MMKREHVFSKTIDLSKMGWTEAKDDEEIIKYVIDFMKQEHGVLVDDETAFAVIWIMDNLLTGIAKGEVVIK